MQGRRRRSHLHRAASPQAGSARVEQPGAVLQQRSSGRQPPAHNLPKGAHQQQRQQELVC